MNKDDALRKLQAWLAVVDARPRVEPRGLLEIEPAVGDVGAGYEAGERARLHSGIERAQGSRNVTQPKMGWV
uniref:hypothetical protein n=1 Tax=Xanthomonas campestris TaxID=339 RepID=UPI0028525B5C|nr:hypothetical protein [Xanthomonas campestris]